MLSFADFIKKVDRARVELSTCKTEGEVDKFFNELEIVNFPTKIAFLRHCMQIKDQAKTFDSNASEEDIYSYYLNIFLKEKLRDIGRGTESVRMDFSFSDETIDSNNREIRESSSTKKICKALDISEDEYVSFKNFYDGSILKRVQKKYLSQLISVIEDMIEEKINKGIEKDKKKNRYKIRLYDSGRIKNNLASCIILQQGAIIQYDPQQDSKSIRILIARELGHLLSYYGFIKSEDLEKYANLFAFFVINEENNLYSKNTKTANYYHNEKEIIKKIKELFKA
jgi:hypothetical protein